MTLEVYMKSGNVIVLDSILEYNIENRGDDITRLEIRWKNPSRRALVKTFCLSSIEAICVRRTLGQRILAFFTGKVTT